MRGMGNMSGMMKQMKQMQKKMAAEQDALNAEQFTGKSPDDMVTATFTGDRQLQDIAIKPEAVDPDDVDMLQDLIVAAVNDGLKQVEKEQQAKMGKYTQGLM